MKKLLVLALLLSGCAIPVRPIARVVPDTDGALHFVPDGAQEPHIPPAVLTGITGLVSALGPWGQIAAAVVGGGGLLAVGHAHGTKKGAKKKHESAPAVPAAA